MRPLMHWTPLSWIGFTMLMSAADSSGKRLARVSLMLIVLAALAVPFADLQITTVEPGSELARMAWGMITPAVPEGWVLLEALAHTVAFALLAVAVAVVIGLIVSLGFRWRLVRIGCAAVRSIHELFWGLIFMQLFGLSALTGLLAILVPYSGIFAKVFAEIFEQQSQQPQRTCSPRSGTFSRALYTLIPQSWPQLTSYTRYRFECALRTSTILGFIGLPTIGFHLETTFKQGLYSEAAALLWAFFALIATIRYWLRPRLIPIYLVAAFWVLPETPPVNTAYLWQFFSQDIWPAALLAGEWRETLAWYQQMWTSAAFPGLIETLLISQIALALTAAMVLLSYGWASRILVNSPARGIGLAVLLVMRATPEMILAFVLLLLFGPSGLPAILALALHNGGLIAYLSARQADALVLRPDAATGARRYLYEVTPRVYPATLDLLFYRWEVILRESAILGMLGVATLGFYIDSAFEDIRYDRAAFLIGVTALLNIAIDGLSRRFRRYVHAGKFR